MGLLGTWAKRIKITIDKDDIDATLTWFPVLLYLSGACGIGNAYDVTPIFDEVGANSLKIAVTKADGTTQLYVEIEKWDNGNEKAWLWVSRDGWEIADDADTEIYIYYDNAQDDNATYVAVAGSRTEVWDDNFELAYHLGESVGDALDSTSHNNDGTFNDDLPDPIAGKIGDGQDLDGTADRIERAKADHDITNAFTFECWFWQDVAAIAEMGPNLRDPAASANGIRIFRNSAGKMCFQNRKSDGSDYIKNYSGATLILADRWYHVVGTWDGTNMEVYLNGAVDTPYTKHTDNAAANTNTDRPLEVGSWNHANYIDGKMDEVRISSACRNSAWVKATYETGRDELLDYGNEEINPVAALVASASIIPLMEVLDLI